MASALSNAQFQNVVNRLRARGFTVTAVSDWKTNNRNHKGPIGPIYVALGLHHTASNADSLNYIDGFIAHTGQGPEVPGPLCNWFIRRAGEIRLVSSGRANHFGKVDGNIINRAKQGLRGVGELKPGSDTIDGNTVAYGVEVAGDGGADDYTQAQTYASIALGAEMCRELGWDSPDCLAHKEVTKRKPGDPVMDMGWYRREVADDLDYMKANGGKGLYGPKGKGGVTNPAPPVHDDDSKPAPNPPKWDGKSFPGAGAFVIGKSHPAVTLLGERLVKHGFGGRYKQGPGPTFSEVDRLSTQDFQLAQGYVGTQKGGGADGYPGKQTWAALMADPKKKPSKPSRPQVSLSAVVAAAKKDTARPQGGTTSGSADDVKIVEAALKKEGLLESKYASDGSFGGSTVTAYSKWQKKCGAVGKGADGIPGMETLKKLGAKYGFDVVK